MFIADPGLGGSVPVSANSSSLGTSAARSEQIQRNTDYARSGAFHDDQMNSSGSGNNGSKDKPWYEQLIDVLNGMVSSADMANEIARQNANSANEFEAEQARLEREFQQYNADTYFQRQRKDLVAAGYNPWMAIYGNGGAGLPTGAQAHATNASTFRRNDSFTDTVMGIITLISSLFSGLSSGSGLDFDIGKNIASGAFKSAMDVPLFRKLFKMWYNVNDKVGTLPSSMR